MASHAENAGKRFWEGTDMEGRRPRTIRWMLGYGVLFGILMVVFFSVFAIALPKIVDDCLNAPAIGLAWLWHEAGLPPQGEAAFAMPLVFGFIQWFIIGALIGLWRCRKLQRKAAPPVNPGQANPSIPPVK